MLSDYYRFRQRRTAPPDADTEANTQSGSATFNSKRQEENLDSNENTSDLGSSESSTNRLHYDPATLAVLESKSTRERDPHRFVRAANGVGERDANSSPVVDHNSANSNSNGNGNSTTTGSSSHAADSKVSLRGKSFGFYGDNDDTDPAASDDWRNSLSSWRDRRKQLITTNLSPELAATVNSNSTSTSSLCQPAAAATVNGDEVRPKALPDASATNGIKAGSRIRSFNEMLKSHSHIVPVFDDDLPASATQTKLETTSVSNTSQNEDSASLQKHKSNTETAPQKSGQLDSAKMRTTSRRSDLWSAPDADRNKKEAINKQQAPTPYVGRSYKEQRDLHTSAVEREGEGERNVPDASQLQTSNHLNGAKQFCNGDTSDVPKRNPVVQSQSETKQQILEDQEKKTQLKATEDSVTLDRTPTRSFHVTSQSQAESPSQSPKLNRHFAAPQPYCAAPAATAGHDVLHSSNSSEFKAPETSNGKLTQESVALSVSADSALESGPEITISPGLQQRQLQSDSRHALPLKLAASSDGEAITSTSSPSLPGVSVASNLLVVQDNRRRIQKRLDNSAVEQPVEAVTTSEPPTLSASAAAPSPPLTVSASASTVPSPPSPLSVSTAAPSSLSSPPPPASAPAAAPPMIPSMKHSSSSAATDAARSGAAAASGSTNANGTESAPAASRPVPASVSALRKRPPRIDTPPPFVINRIAAANAAAAAAAAAAPDSASSAAGLRTNAPGLSNVAASPSTRNNTPNSITPPSGQPQLPPALLTPAAVALTSDGDQAQTAAGRSKFKIDLSSSIGTNAPNINTAQSKPEIAPTSSMTTAVVVRQRQPPLAMARARQMQATSPGTNSNGQPLGPAPMRVLPSQFSKPFSSNSNGSDQLSHSNPLRLQSPTLTAHANGDGTNTNSNSNPRFAAPGVTSASNRNQSVPTSGQQVCSGCRQALSAGSAMYIEQLKSMYHTKCFICSSCRCSLVSPDGVVANVYIRDQQLNCLACSSSSSSTASRAPEALSQGLKGHLPLPLPPPAARVRSDAALYSSQPALIQPQPDVLRPSSGALPRPDTYV